MNPNAQLILQTLTDYLTANPSIRFTRALFNLGINEFQSGEGTLFRDNYNDTDERVLKKMKNGTARNTKEKA